MTTDKTGIGIQTTTDTTITATDTNYYYFKIKTLQTKERTTQNVESHNA